MKRRSRTSTAYAQEYTQAEGLRMLSKGQVYTVCQCQLRNSGIFFVKCQDHNQDQPNVTTAKQHAWILVIGSMVSCHRVRGQSVRFNQYNQQMAQTAIGMFSK